MRNILITVFALLLPVADLTLRAWSEPAKHLLQYIPLPNIPNAAPSEWVCPDGYTAELDDNGNWVTDDAGIPQCVEASILDDF